MEKREIIRIEKVGIVERGFIYIIEEEGSVWARSRDVIKSPDGVYLHRKFKIGEDYSSVDELEEHIRKYNKIK